MSASSSYTSRAAGIGAGLVLLLTFVIPFAPQVWAWDKLKTFAQVPLSEQGFLITAWAVGLLALLCGVVLRRMWLAAGYLMLGAGGAVAVFSCLEVAFLPLFRSATVHWISAPGLDMIGYGAVAAFLVVTGIRTRLGAGRFLCALQILLGAGLALLLGICLYDGFRSVVAQRPFLSARGWRKSLFTLIVQGMLALSAGMALVHGFAVRASGSGVSRVARRLAMVTMVAMPILALVFRGKPAIVYLPHVNPLIMGVCILIVLLEGVTAVLSEIGAMIGPPPAPAVSRESVMAQLRELDAARAHGAIAAEAYNAHRDKLLDQL